MGSLLPLLLLLVLLLWLALVLVLVKHGDVGFLVAACGVVGGNEGGWAG